MFHHRSCGTADLVALMAAHRAALRDVTALRQQDITRLLHRLEEEEEEAPASHGEAARPATARVAMPS
ncbi:hypothetical protein QMO56_12815 [Roseomonas sp. E05]|uniref:hypothetical protein n=1 Tax=Roseomonas sp. E05 TaxID=3046310 RepID=UPI0024BA4AF7|nr:hypothetical protein [Roseomonas sp. E05]MDJ0388998.1 hypothetical protein [Roseomonas sp. E05]